MMPCIWIFLYSFHIDCTYLISAVPHNKLVRKAWQGVGSHFTNTKTVAPRVSVTGPRLCSWNVEAGPLCRCFLNKFIACLCNRGWFMSLLLALSSRVPLFSRCVNSLEAPLMLIGWAKHCVISVGKWSSNGRNLEPRSHWALPSDHSFTSYESTECMNPCQPVNLGVFVSFL